MFCSVPYSYVELACPSLFDTSKFVCYITCHIRGMPT
jgi:hypothetical protein